MRDFLDNIRYAWQERKTPYIDHMTLRKRYLENRKLYDEKMNSVSVHLKNNDLTQTVKELFSAVKYSDTSDLWERKASLAKNINDNRDDVKGSLVGTITGYSTSGATTIAMIPAIYTKGSNVIYDIFFWGLLAALMLGIYTGRFNQNRLKRLVQEHKDYTREFDEITGLLERKKI